MDSTGTSFFYLMSFPKGDTARMSVLILRKDPPFKGNGSRNIDHEN
jgi:hypothetical protein